MFCLQHWGTFVSRFLKWNCSFNSSVSLQEIWPASIHSCWRTLRRCRASQSSASGWSYSPGPSPCPASMTTNNTTCLKAPPHREHILRPYNSSNVIIWVFFKACCHGNKHRFPTLSGSCQLKLCIKLMITLYLPSNMKNKKSYKCHIIVIKCELTSF